MRKWKHLTQKDGGDIRIYRIWNAIRNRIDNENHPSYKNIKICDEWLDFDNFYDWAYNNGYYDQPEDTDRLDMLSIDRIDTFGDYTPDNCQWIPLRDNLKKLHIDRPEVRTYVKGYITIEHQRYAGKIRGKQMEKRCFCITNNTEYSSVLEASKALGVPADQLSACCRGDRKKTHGLEMRYING